MPELPDIDVYVERIEERVVGRTLQAIRIASPFLLRSVSPAASELENQPVASVRRIGKRIAIGLASDDWLVLHLMIAGRLQWRDKPPSIGGRNQLAAFDFDHGSLLLTEAGHKKRASLYLVRGQ